MLTHELPLSATDWAQLRAFAPGFRRLCEELAAAGIPETIQHDALHGNNVYRRDGAASILDWGDSCLSHPFLTLFVVFLHLEEMEGLAPPDPLVSSSARHLPRTLGATGRTPRDL
jgi:hypothetical protein